MKLISYALFDGNAQPFEKAAYIRGFYWNARMNNFLYPDWRTHLEVDRATYQKYQRLFDWLVENNTLHLTVNEGTPPLCEGMLWRMKPVFTIDVSHVLCRDADSVTTYREAQCVQQWLEHKPYYQFHAINDNPAHSGLMGGMVGFDTAMLKSLMGWNSFEDIVRGHDLSQRGSDQHLLNGVVHPKISGWLMQHKLAGSGVQSMVTYESAGYDIPNVSTALWESNLTCRHIGSAGVVEMEMLRFFERFDIYNWKFKVIEKEFPQIFYWWNL